MKKLCVVFLSLVLGVAAVSADQNTYSKPGSLSAQAGLGLHWGAYDAIDVEGGADFGLAQVPLADALPLDLGVSGRVGISTRGGVAAGAFGTLHYSWKALGTKLDWLNRLESYIALGVQIIPELWLDGYGGNAFHFDPHLAVFFESGYHGAVLGLSYKFN